MKKLSPIQIDCMRAAAYDGCAFKYQSTADVLIRLGYVEPKSPGSEHYIITDLGREVLAKNIKTLGHRMCHEHIQDLANVETGSSFISDYPRFTVNCLLNKGLITSKSGQRYKFVPGDERTFDVSDLELTETGRLELKRSQDMGWL